MKSTLIQSFIICNLAITIFYSCQYFGKPDRTNKSDSSMVMNPEVSIPRLPNTLKETSGLLTWDHLLWTINDSGGKNKLYGFHPRTGHIEKDVSIVNATNHDWEALAADENYIYIGDIGNNKGNRRDLKIYKVAKDLIQEDHTEVRAEVITFSWADQDRYTWLPQSHPYDCEAMIAFRDSLYLFTKNWSQGMTKMYGVSKQPGSYELHPIDSFMVSALVTDADISPAGDILVLTCYFQYTPSLWIFYDFMGDALLSGQKIQVRYPDFYNAQTEGVAFWNADTLFVSAEKSKRFPQAIYQFDMRYLKDSILLPAGQ